DRRLPEDEDEDGDKDEGTALGLGQSVLLDVLPPDPIAHPRLPGNGDVPVALQRVADRFEVGGRRVTVHAGGFEAALVILADVLAGGAQDLEVAEAAHVDLALDAERLAD